MSSPIKPGLKHFFRVEVSTVRPGSVSVPHHLYSEEFLPCTYTKCAVFRFKPFPFALSLHVLVIRPSPSFVVAPFRYCSKEGNLLSSLPRVFSAPGWTSPIPHPVLTGGWEGLIEGCSSLIILVASTGLAPTDPCPCAEGCRTGCNTLCASAYCWYMLSFLSINTQ